MRFLLAVSLWLLCLPFCAYGSEGVKALVQGDYWSAVTIFSQTIESAPGPSYGNRCLAYLLLGEFHQAELDCTAGLAYLPQNPELWLDRGLARYHQGDYEGAIADFNRGIALDPANYRLFYNLGLAHSANHSPQASLSAYTQALALAPPDDLDARGEILTDRGIEWMMMGQLTAALTDFQTAIELNPDHSRAWFHRGCAHHRLHQLDLAIQDFDRVLSLEPRNPDAYKARAFVEQQQGEIDRALADLDRALDYFWADQNFTEYAALQILKEKWQIKRYALRAG